jgi:hypothetical protein
MNTGVGTCLAAGSDHVILSSSWDLGVLGYQNEYRSKNHIIPNRSLINMSPTSAPEKSSIIKGCCESDTPFRYPYHIYQILRKKLRYLFSPW